MTDSKPIWSGKYAGIDADVRLRGKLPVPYLAGQMAIHSDDVRGIMDVAVRELAAELSRVREAATKSLDIAEKLNRERDERNAIMSQSVDVAEEASRLLTECAAENDAMRERFAILEGFVWQLAEHGCAEFDERLKRARDFLTENGIRIELHAEGSANGETEAK